jgi:hypothetical protein
VRLVIIDLGLGNKMTFEFRGGYKQGETKNIVIEAHRLQLTVEETMRRSGKSYSAIYGASMRNGFKLASEDGRLRSGFVKSSVAQAEKDGISVFELNKRTGIKVNSIRVCSSYYGFKLKKHCDFTKEQQIKQNGKTI